MKYILSLDQGTTSSRAIIYDENLHQVAAVQKEFTQYFPQTGWVEHDPEEIWASVLATARAAVAKAMIKPGEIAAIGITNQRETIVVWEKSTGKPVYPAIVWQDRRTSEYVAALKEGDKENLVQQRTGLLLDPYFSASKLHWILRQIPDGHTRAEAGELSAGTIDSWLISKLTGGKSHITDVTNASRTMLMNIRTGQWDKDLLALFDIPRNLLPEIVSSSGALAMADATHFGEKIPICSAVGDQQSALFGQLCTKPGLVKCTYGTGCFMLLFTGTDAISSSNRLLTTVAWRLGNEPMQYALEGSVFMGGASIQWLRDGLGIIKTAPEVNDLAGSVNDSGGVILVPAFTGLGAPYWDPSARGTLLGLSRGTTAAHIARATLDGIAFQVADLLISMERDSGRRISILRVDGGASASNLLIQTQSDLLGTTVERPINIESTALGAAMMAGLGAGIWPDIDFLTQIREVDRKFTPNITAKERRARMKIWKKAVKRAQGWETNL
ncbi:MAG: glycerol kinase GlpK [Verrucomicrobiota bacterium]|nr:glycerol kinase GlpK [Verrucomicrobiota bacterium]